MRSKPIDIGANGRRVFFTSDIHLGDERLNLYGRDILFNNVLEFHRDVISKWNSIVRDDDLVVVVGDVSFSKKYMAIMDELNGEKWLVKGNYDVPVSKGGTAKFDVTDDFLKKYFTKVVDELDVIIGDEVVHVNHYPTNAVTDKFNIVGHIHGTWKVQRNMVNVGMDAWHFTPVPMDMISFQMNGIRMHYDQNVFAGELNANIDKRIGTLKVLMAPEQNDTFDVLGREDVYVFLAGPIQGAADWQGEIIDRIKTTMNGVKFSKNIILCSPRSPKSVMESEFNYDRQVDWESKYLNLAAKLGVLVFWMPNESEHVDGRSYAQTTRFELGEWWAKCQSIDGASMVVGIEDGFPGARYIKKKFGDEYPGVKVRSGLDELVDDILERVIEKASTKIG